MKEYSYGEILLRLMDIFNQKLKNIKIKDYDTYIKIDMIRRKI